MQVHMIVALLGTPTEQLWPGFLALPLTKTFLLPTQPYNCLRDRFSLLSPAGLGLLHGLLTYDPARRLTVREALQHDYLCADPPLACHPDLLPTFPDHRYLTSGGASGAGGGATQPRQQ
jgi:cyclin-dependent kinase 10